MLPTVEPLGEGLDHSAYLLNGELVVRFRRSPAEADQVAAEGRLLAFVSGISPVPVPRPVFVDAGCMAYPRLPGVPLISAGAAPASVGSRLGELLAVLHAVRPEQVAGFAEVDDTPPAEWLAEAVELWPSVAEHVPAAYRPAVETFLAAQPPAAAVTLVFSHQDLGIEHVLADPVTGAVTGVIDWSDAAVGDPARDFGLILRDLGPAALTAALHSTTRPRRGGEVSPRGGDVPPRGGGVLSRADDVPSRGGEVPSRGGDVPSAGGDAGLVRRAEFYARCGLIADLAYGVASGRAEYTTKSLTGLAWIFTH